MAVLKYFRKIQELTGVEIQIYTLSLLRKRGFCLHGSDRVSEVYEGLGSQD